MKQTAVEKMIQYFIEQKNNGASHWCIDDLIAQLHQAKAMEKKEELQQWIEIWSLGYDSGWDNCMKKHERNKSE